MAYLGKISAVLSANTQDFTRGLREAGQELSRFQKQASGLRVNLDSNALDKTLTSLQRFEKTIQEIKKQIAANPEQRSLFPDPNRLQQQFKAFENIGKPLTELKNKIEGLSQTMQAGLYPALGQIQASFQNLYRGIQSGSTTYDKEAARIEGLIGALNRLQKTAAAAADFGDLTKKLTASNTGASFYQPRAKESLQDSLALRNRAESVPARFRGGVFADLAAAAEENAQKIEAQAARILQIQNRIGNAGPATPMAGPGGAAA
jgi:DNA repair exonuclease SbcCD ATPase subunit